MFIGHYGVSFAAKAVSKTVPIWILFLAVQFVDVIWAILVLLDIEKLRIVPGITATNPLDLYYMPYTHGLITTLIWGLAAGIGYYCIRSREPWKTAAIVALAVISHWLLDLLVHRPDLPLYGDVHKVGLGLWNYPAIAFTLEVILLFAGLVLYLRATPSLSRGRRQGFVVSAGVMVLVQSVVFFGAPPASDDATAISALVSYALFAAIAYALEPKTKQRSRPEQTPTATYKISQKQSTGGGLREY